VGDRGDDPGKLDAVTDPHRDLAGVLHDVSNALTVLLGWIGETRGPDATPESVADALKIIEQRARIARDLARQAIGSPFIDEQRPVGLVAAEVTQALRVEATHRGATILVKGEGETTRIAGSLDLSQILTNLVMNAIAHAPPGTEVLTEITVSDEACSLVVSDRGPGVDASRREGIFRGDSLRPGGTGVGLRHSRDLAQANGGDLELLSPSPAGGARFRIEWPRADVAPPAPCPSPVETEEASEPQKPRARLLTGVRVLLVEDDVAVTQLLETALEGRGADVTTIATGAELTAALSTGPFDAALLDLSPIADDVDGAIARLQNNSPGIELVLITGSADRLPDVVATASMKLVRKPFELGEVLAALSKKP
jgi:CheY-like chemotaxis protein